MKLVLLYILMPQIRPLISDIEKMVVVFWALRTKRKLIKNGLRKI